MNSRSKMAAFLVATLFAFLSPAFAVSSQQESGGAKVEEKASTKQAEEQKECRAFLEQLKKLEEKNDTAELWKRMTPSCQNDFFANNVLMVVSMASDDSPELDKLRVVVEKHKLDSIKIPESISDMNGYPSEEDFEKAEKAVLDAIKKEARLGVLSEIAAAFPPEEFGGTFAGKVVNVTTGDEVVTLELKQMLSEEELAEIEAEMPGVEIMMPNMFLDFVKTKAGWKWDGFNEELENKAMEEMDMEAGGMDLEPLTIIDDLVIEGKTVDGEAVSLKDYSGKVVLVDFWGTWCPPCVAELPNIKRIHQALNEHGFEVVGVAVDESKKLKGFYKNKQKLPWKNICDAEGKLADKYNINRFPTTLLVNKEGKHIKSDLHGVKLVDEIVKLLNLDPKDFAALRKELKESEEKAYGDFGPEESEDKDVNSRRMEVGFSAADADGSGGVSPDEMETYLDERLQDDELPHRKVFKRIDADKDGLISDSEFEKRHDAIVFFMGDEYFGGGDMSAPSDPGKGFVPYKGLDQPVDDKAIFGAIYHRYYELLDKEDQSWRDVELDSVPLSIKPTKLDNEDDAKTDVQRLIDSSVIIAGGDRDFFTAGAVIVSRDGLAITNYHVAEAMQDTKLVGMTADGKCHRVTEIIAGNLDRDVALVRLSGSGFKPVKIATSKPGVGENIVMMHHSENRFFTYDRGYVMRHPKIGEHPWMEISADYAPGGSGCGIFNQNLELVGLVSIIQYGDGPSLAEGMDLSIPDEEYNESDFAGGGPEMGMLLVKHAVPVDAIHSLWNVNAVEVKPESEAEKVALPDAGSLTLNNFAAEPSKYFEAPVALSEKGRALNQNHQIYYPSPAVFDIDNDKKDELVVGSIMGTISVFENESSAGQEPKWTLGESPEHDGKPVVLDNW